MCFAATAMDVENGKIVSARADQRKLWSGLKPSRGLTAENSGHGSSRGGREWAPSSCFSDEAPLNAWGGAVLFRGQVAAGLGMEPGAARWSHRPAAEKPHSVVALHACHGFHPPAVEHRLGWGGDQARHNPLAAKACSLDQMMTMYESQITRTVSGHFAKTLVSSPSLGHDTPPAPPAESEKSEDRSTLQHAASDAGVKLHESEAQSSPKSTLAPVHTSSDLKRKRAEVQPSYEQDQADCAWSHPLKLLVRKGLSVSDVGELGRIVIPKKYAESQFSQFDTKEGTLLEMEDYNGSKRWFFRFKWWNNNKSRMYVLENTGEFIKYHSLKEHDIFVVYEDSSRKMVVRGHKGTDLDITLDIPQGTNVGSASVKSSFTKEERTTSTPALA